MCNNVFDPKCVLVVFHVVQCIQEQLLQRDTTKWSYKGLWMIKIKSFMQLDWIMKRLVPKVHLMRGFFGLFTIINILYWYRHGLKRTSYGNRIKSWQPLGIS